MKKEKNIIGNKINMLLVVELSYEKFDKNNKIVKYYKCLCDCGNYKIIIRKRLYPSFVKL